MDEYYMGLAINLARKGIGKVNPNPMVGAVIVKDNKIVGTGYHEKYGGKHAEVNAIENSRESLNGSTMYVNLEPCSHFGKTPPCVDKIIESKINKVVIASVDPNPLVQGKGVKKLRDSGIEVKVGVLDEENKKLNEVFLKYIKNKKPFVAMKVAMSLDGKIATSTGQSKWISCDESRRYVHKLRSEVMSILVGINTVIKDDPMLDCRLENGKNPIRIIVDTTLKIPIDSKIVSSSKSIRTIVVTTKNANRNVMKLLEGKGVEILTVNLKNNLVDLKEMINKLGELNIDSILIEGGSSLNFSAMNENIVDKIQVYVAPIILGGESSKTPIGGQGVDDIKEAFKLHRLEHKQVGSDILIEGYLKGSDE
ncbi:riboflavin biosynthesis protein RibD [[Clostridium] bifermentans ATCC 638]|uniref:Riboflavin biosynthesis protein RibD n=1 Tax=Paraclostridium bifermentans ATCC 638 = DSM 14991 TaxID=1233171 RepID=T4VN14_PARBF|nr:bifunctional diaminohydroxyphosphoribosylaminopyrimidine deaminase/5-amino-6-(5-phosphoribosylamino)uracil reductase RibD [Paraclostridium bifermentans]EQK42893.1 riboflavin biosynthesis protein RibD [[Clostridium] bifermentans ATCC 638] [Paraclostridium bifermentans ATCC 638 = DSM 14991]RIZ58024.1 bifunctional diaminohydroxyphosphoribosylaminopyrimidine deaminase/5-amino-6-(5-phosphoribosylamino)uracil reductase [Paraclostridium bifermentans]UAG16777.1 bifunctional diaminohydroxyphosphoribos